VLLSFRNALEDGVDPERPAVQVFISSTETARAIRTLEARSRLRFCAGASSRAIALAPAARHCSAATQRCALVR
jgi:hypothetical protein